MIAVVLRGSIPLRESFFISPSTSNNSSSSLLSDQGSSSIPLKLAFVSRPGTTKRRALTVVGWATYICPEHRWFWFETNSLDGTNCCTVSGRKPAKVWAVTKMKCHPRRLRTTTRLHCPKLAEISRRVPWQIVAQLVEIIWSEVNFWPLNTAYYESCKYFIIMPMLHYRLLIEQIHTFV